MHDSLRPTSFDGFVGQPQLKQDLTLLIQAALKREETPDHVLLAGPPGLGKTTLSTVIANELNMNLVTTSAPTVEKPGDLIALLSGLNTPSVVFIDEIHALDRRAEEMLYSAMEDFCVDFIVGEGPQARSLRINVEPFMLVGATTQMGSVTGPLRDRFGLVGRLKPYSVEELAEIVSANALKLGLKLEPQAALTIAARSRSTPRVANQWLRRVRDWVQVHGHTHISAAHASTALSSFGIDELGLDELARDILQTICAQYQGGPVGLANLAAALNESEATLEQVYEPHLMRTGLLLRTPRGRVVSPLGWQHLGLTPPASSQASLLD